MTTVLIKILIFFCNFIYFFMKLLKTQNKITFISRQSNTINKDFLLLKNDLAIRYPKYKVVILCKKIEKGMLNKIKYIFHMLRQMYHIATSKVVVLDSYCIPISILKHKKSLKVIQMWHALGSFKKFGYSVQDKKEGTSAKINQLMKMHKNYDYIFTSSEACRPFFAQAFGYDESYFKINPLPRLDLLKNSKYKNNKIREIYHTYPNLKKKKTILYAPTFRIKEHGLINKEQSNDVEYIEKLINEVNFDEYNFILKTHPLSKITIKDDRIIRDKKFTTLDMLFVSDYVITDYSAMVYEASFLEKPLFFYAYDIDTYLKDREFYLNFRTDMPGIITKDAKEIIRAIEQNSYSFERVKEFKNRSILKCGNYTKRINDFIISLMEEKKKKDIKQ